MNLIVAVDKDWGIGKNNNLLVNIPEDMKFFRTTTTSKTVAMGRKTLESFPGKKPLKNRKNVVLTGSPEYKVDGAVVVNTIEDLLKECDDDTFVIGGGSIYKQLLPYCSVAYVTRIYQSFGADTFFPNLDAKKDWEIVEESGIKEHEGIKYQFFKYVKKN